VDGAGAGNSPALFCAQIGPVSFLSIFGLSIFGLSIFSLSVVSALLHARCG
jgi:hypothetical protein